MMYSEGLACMQASFMLCTTALHLLRVERGCFVPPKKKGGGGGTQQSTPPCVDHVGGAVTIIMRQADFARSSAPRWQCSLRSAQLFHFFFYKVLWAPSVSLLSCCFTARAMSSQSWSACQDGELAEEAVSWAAAFWNMSLELEGGERVEEAPAAKRSATTCPACDKAFRLPKLLNCLHTLCEDCLRDRLHPDGSITCPVCGNVTQLPLGGFLGLPFDWMVNDVQRRQFLETSSADFAVLCEECISTEDATAASVCLDCRAFLCDCHTEAHKKTRTTRSHELVERSERNEKGVEEALCSAAVSCSIHTLRPIVGFCTTCHRPICNSCLALGHREHEQVSVDTAAALQRQQLRELGQEFSNDIIPLMKQTEETAEVNLDLLEARAQELSQEICTLVQNQIQKLREFEQGLLSEVERLRATKAKPIEERRKILKKVLPDAERAVSVASTALDLRNDGEFLQVEAGIARNMQDLQKSLKPHLVPDVVDYDQLMEFVPNRSLLDSVNDGVGTMQNGWVPACQFFVLKYRTPRFLCSPFCMLLSMTAKARPSVCPALAAADFETIWVGRLTIGCRICKTMAM